MRKRNISNIFILIILAMILNACGSKETEYDVSSTAISINNIYNNSVTDDENDNKDVMEQTEIEEGVNTGSIDSAAIEDIKNAKAGDCVLFGQYEQNGDDSNGMEPIEWIVLDADEDKILLLSKYVIEKKPYNETDKTVGWAGCTLRKWLNEDFIVTAFDDAQVENIIEVEIDNPGSKEFFKEFGKSMGTAAAKKTKDKVFLLSYSEILEYYKPSKVDKFCVYVDKDLITTATLSSGIKNTSLSLKQYESFYKAEGWPQDCVELNGSGWFLRSPGVNADDVMSVGYDGAVRGLYLEYGQDYESVDFEGGVRPAMWILKTAK